jgi:hypothetical protein
MTRFWPCEGKGTGSFMPQIAATICSLSHTEEEPDAAYCVLGKRGESFKVKG